MKPIYYIIASLLIALVATVLWITHSEVKPIDKPVVTFDPRVSKAPEQTLDLAQRLLQADEIEVPTVSSAEQLQLAETLKNKKVLIDSQIALLNENLHNRDKRQEIQTNLAKLIEEYNQAALPFILDEIAKE